MYANSYRPRSSMEPRRRPTYPRSAGRSKNRKQDIHPSRFVKIADPTKAGDYTAANAFADFAIHPLLKNNVAAKGYLSPSEIQDKTIELGLTGHDVVGVASTGTGKTAAFALPILNKLMHDPATKGLIVAPTRELAIQIDEQCRQLAKHSGLTNALLIGGVPLGGQITALKNGARMIIGTPGRIKDHLGQNTLSLSNCSMVVLDEVDRMLDMGFINDVRAILALLPPERQSFFFSATLSPEINVLIQTFTRQPITINVKASETSDNVHQDIVAYAGKAQKIDRLHNVLINPLVKKSLIFGEMKYGVERLARELKARGFKADALHGGKTQGQRKRAMASFRDNSINILVATDVAARGIDVVDITHVINYDVPHTYNDYIHRIGRAGRAGRVGHALTFVEATDRPN